MNPDGTGQRQLSLRALAGHQLRGFARRPQPHRGRRRASGQAAGRWRRRARRSPPDGVLEIDPAFSPDGAQIAFGRVDPVTGGGLGLWTSPVAGGDASQVVLPERAVACHAHPGSVGAVPEPAPILRAPRYSPDGAALAYRRHERARGSAGAAGRPAHDRPFAAVEPAGLAARLDGLAAVRLARRVAGAGGAGPAGARPWIPAAWTSRSFELGALRLARLERGAQLGASCWTSRPAPPARRRDRTGATCSSRCSPRPPMRAAPCG